MIRWLVVCIVFTALCGSESQNKRVLVFSKTAGFYHKSIPDAVTAVIKLGQQNRFVVDTTKDAAQFNLKNLKRYRAVIFLNTTGNVLDDEQQQAFEKYIRSGGGFVGVHAAADTEYDWPWYGKLVGAYFQSHPAVQQASLDVINSSHPATKNLPGKWVRVDEWYNYKSISDKIKVLMTIDESSYTGKRMDTYHPISWYQEFDGGRAFYTGLGHTKESFTEDTLFLQHLLGGIKYAMK